MLIQIIEIPRGGAQSHHFRKLLKLQCDECNVVYERRWQREVSERTVHFCCLKHMISWRSKQESWHINVSNATRKAMKTDVVQANYRAGLKLRNDNPEWRKNMSKSAIEKYRKNPELGKQLGLLIRRKFKDPEFKTFFKSRLIPGIRPWWKSWMEINKNGVHWANRIIRLFNSECAKCCSKTKLHAHHIAPKSKHPELKFDLNNGVALCNWCHMKKENTENVHEVLRTNPIAYEALMKELLLKRNECFLEGNY